MFQARNKLMLCIVFAFAFFLGNVENARAVCAPEDPTVVINPALNFGAEESVLGYTLTVTNNDDDPPCVAGVDDRVFSLTITLPAAPCIEDSWTETLPLNTPAIVPGGFVNIPFTVTSCRGPYTSADSFSFTITASQGGDSGSDSAVYDITGSSSEICDDSPGLPADDDGDGFINCDDSDCLGNPACCGNGIIEGLEACDGLTNCPLPKLCSVSCGACNLPLTPPSTAGPCEPRGKIGGLVPCGRVLNDPVTPWNETAPCNLCHVVPTIYNIINYLIGIVGIFTILFIVLGMLMSITSIGGSGGLAAVKLVISKSVLGFVAVLVAWLIVNLVMVLFGFSDPMGDGSWRKISCNLDTTFCGDGIVNGVEVCEPGVTPDMDCQAVLGVGYPLHCAGIEVAGKRSCNCTCNGWNECTANAPTPIDGNYGQCNNATTYVLDYACCDLVSCGADACCGGANSGPSSLPPGYVFSESIGYSGGNCVLGQSTRDWAIGINHTTGYFQCWK
ncbi:MAG: pilin [Candidatus Paceibacterota bacterium]|jgi:hypothetical protein